MLCCGIGGFGCVGVSTGGYGKPENIPGKVINNNSQSRSVVMCCFIEQAHHSKVVAVEMMIHV